MTQLLTHLGPRTIADCGSKSLKFAQICSNSLKIAQNRSLASLAMTTLCVCHHLHAPLSSSTASTNPSPPCPLARVTQHTSNTPMSLSSTDVPQQQHTDVPQQHSHCTLKTVEHYMPSSPASNSSIFTLYIPSPTTFCRCSVCSRRMEATCIGCVKLIQSCQLADLAFPCVECIDH